MVRCLVNELHTSTVEKAVVADEEGSGALAPSRIAQVPDNTPRAFS